MIQSIYFQHTPEHLKPKRPACPASSNRAVRNSERDASGAYAKAREGTHYFKRRVLPRIEAARKRGDLVCVVAGSWFVNGLPLEV